MLFFNLFCPPDKSGGNSGGNSKGMNKNVALAHSYKSNFFGIYELSHCFSLWKIMQFHFIGFSQNLKQLKEVVQ